MTVKFVRYDMGNKVGLYVAAFGRRYAWKLPFIRLPVEKK